MKKNLQFIFDSMEQSGFAVPEYVRVKRASGELPDTENHNINHSTRANIWVSTLKLACFDYHPVIKEEYAKRLAQAAQRYDIFDDIKEAAAFVDAMDTQPETIHTEQQWQEAFRWLQKNAEFLDADIKEGIADHLFEKAAELNYIPALSEEVELNLLAGRDELNEANESIAKLAEENLHKLANGHYYTTAQFESLPFDEVNRLMPELMKLASLNLPVIHPPLFAKAASRTGRAEADVLSELLEKYGQKPVYSEQNRPVRITDSILASL